MENFWTRTIPDETPIKEARAYFCQDVLNRTDFVYIHGAAREVFEKGASEFCSTCKYKLHRYVGGHCKNLMYERKHGK